MRLVLVILVVLLGMYVRGGDNSLSKHKSGHDLLVTLNEEKDTLFLILWFKDMFDSPRQIAVNNKARSEIEAMVAASHPGVVYVEVDMSNSNLNAYTYERLATKQLGLNLYELEYGPVAVVLKSGVGSLVVFKGNYDSFFKSVDSQIHLANEKNEKNIDTKSASEKAKELAKQKQLPSSRPAFNYYRPSRYEDNEYQGEQRIGYEHDPTYNENPVAFPR